MSTWLKLEAAVEAGRAGQSLGREFWVWTPKGEITNAAHAVVSTADEPWDGDYTCWKRVREILSESEPTNGPK